MTRKAFSAWRVVRSTPPRGQNAKIGGRSTLGTWKSLFGQFGVFFDRSGVRGRYNHNLWYILAPVWHIHSLFWASLTLANCSWSFACIFAYWVCNVVAVLYHFLSHMCHLRVICELFRVNMCCLMWYVRCSLHLKVAFWSIWSVLRSKCSSWSPFS